MKKIFLTPLLIIATTLMLKAQNDVMMQAFYWNVPTDVTNKNGTWWDNLRLKVPELKTAGFNCLWVPPPSKGNWAMEDVGYGIYDHYDLGAYNQKGSTETRYGSKAELTSFLTAAHATTNGARLDVFADVVLNHTYGNFSNASGIENEEANAGLKAYVRAERLLAYQTSDIKWVIPNATAGDYYIQIKGYALDWAGANGERGYNLNVNWLGSAETDPSEWEVEPNNGGGQSNIISVSGRTKRAHADYSGDIDEFKITLTSTKTIVIKLTAMREASNPWAWSWGDQTHGFYPLNVWKNGVNLALTTLEARTPTKSTYPTHTGSGEANYQWSWADYHPVNASDWLGGDDGSDNIIPNQRWFGNDFNTYSTTVQSRLNAWGVWLTSTIGFDGYRLDFVRGFQIPFVASWINNLPKIGGTAQRYIVGEYWTENRSRLKEWIDGNSAAGATVSVFDFPLRAKLKDMCNGTQSSFDMRWLNHSGMVRADDGNAVSGTRVSTFLDNHDNAKNSHQWVSKDWKMGYAYILTHEGRPCVLYNHYYAVAEQDWENGSPTTTVTAPVALQTDIKKLMFVRKTYLGGTTTVLSSDGNPYPASDAYNVYVARRDGNGTKSGAIIVINNHATATKGLWVNNNTTGWTNWAGLWLKNALNPSERTQVQADGRVWVQAPARGYAIYVLESQYVAYTAKSLDEQNSEDVSIQDRPSIFAFPNPFNESTSIQFSTISNSKVSVVIYDQIGRVVETLFSGNKQAGPQQFVWNRKNSAPGMYFAKIEADNTIQTIKLLISK